MENGKGSSVQEGCVLVDMKFSVLMSVYKNEKAEYLNTALKSIVNQSLMPNEIIIVKDGILTDELDKCLDDFYEAYENIVKVIPFAENRGLGLALRDGVLACSNEYIARMDTDDIAFSNRFEEQFEFLKKHEDISLVGSWITEFSNDSLKPDTITKLPCKHSDIVNYAKKRNPFRHMTVIFKKKAVLDSGNYRDFLWFEDYDLWVRIIQKGYKTANIPKVLVNVRATDDMFARRGGLRYIKQEIRFQNSIRKQNFISMWNSIENLIIRSIVRIFPNKLRVYCYKTMLRYSEK